MRAGRRCPGCREFPPLVARLNRELERAKSRIRVLEAELESARRAAKRQAAPFSKGPPVRRPARPGRKPGAAYGVRARRSVPAVIDEVCDAPLPGRCPDCGGELAEIGVVSQYQTEVPAPRPVHRRIDIHTGRCRACGRTVRGRHRLQTSDATGAASSQLGPRALAIVGGLTKGLGLSFDKTRVVMEGAFGIRLSRAGAWHATARTARAAEPTYRALTAQVRRAPAVTADETGWKVEGILRWLWVFATPQMVVYRIGRGRGYEEAAALLGKEYAGVLVRDGWAPYRKFTAATHQTCLAHLSRRCREMIADADRGGARVPHALARVLKEALAVRDARDAGSVSAEVARETAGALTARVEVLLAGKVRHPPNVRLLKHVATERDALFTFLTEPGVDATNFRAEQAIRPIVVTRKVSGGNREWTGARAQEILCSVLQTCRLQGRDPQATLIELVCSPTPLIAPIALDPVRGPPG